MFGYGRHSAITSTKWDPTITPQKVRSGTFRRVLTYARPYRRQLVIFVVVTALDALITVVNPLMLRLIIDRGILRHDERAVVTIASIMVAVALFDVSLGLAIRWFSAQIGEGLTYDLRTQVFGHVLRQPVAFFTRAQTGSLVSRLNTDVIGAQQAVTVVLSSVISNLLALVVILVTIFYLSWIVGIVGLVLVPIFIIPAMVIGNKLARLTREGMQLDAEMGSTMTERFNVSGALLVKLFGRLPEDTGLFAKRAAKVRAIAVLTTMYGQVFIIALTFLAALATAVVYGVGGTLIIRGAFALGTLVALAGLVMRLYGPIGGLTDVPANLLQALVSFDRVFEVLDLEPLITDKPDAVTLSPAGSDGKAPDVEFDHVSFRYPTAREVSLASLETIALPAPERTDAPEDVLHDVSFHVPSGQLTALVGPSGAGKTTITQLAARLYDPTSGVVRIGGQDLTEVTQSSLHSVIGVVTQDAHLFHETIRANLAYAKPDVTEQEMIEACKAAQIWDLVASLPDGFNTVVGDRGYRLSGGEKQRIALARLLIKAPAVVVLDEATAHLDSESEAAVQGALKVVLAGRTSLVIAHRLSTIREADQILVIEAGRVIERGRHEGLLAAGGTYTDLYRTQFAGQEKQPA